MRNLTWKEVGLMLSIGMCCALLHNAVGMNQEMNNRVDEIISLNTICAEQQEQIEDLKAENVELYEQIAGLSEELDNITVLDYDYDYVVGVVAAEAQNQPVEGQMAVAQVIQNRSTEWGLTPEEVVKQDYQFATPLHKDDVTEEVKASCERVFLKGEKVTNKPIKWFCTVNIFPKTHMSKVHAFTIADHKFFM